MSKYSETLTDHVMAPRNGGAIENPDLTGHAGAPGRGAFMILYLKVQYGANRGGEVSHRRLRADDRVGIDADGNDRREIPRRLPRADGREPDRSLGRRAAG